ncbi:MAG: DUF4301 family protein [Paludibacteraceae bacterium]|nr:DUF4301 family protein [Paludibacteraceae bacterium]
MLTEKDYKQLTEKGLTEKDVLRQVDFLKKGGTRPEIVRTASLEDGILNIPEDQQDSYLHVWDNYLGKKKTIVHFIPASGTASRFLRELRAFMQADYETPQTNYEKNFFKHLESFAFFTELNDLCKAKLKKKTEELIEEGQYKQILHYMLSEDGLNYDHLPIALFKFHTDKGHRFATMEKYLPRRVMNYYSSFLEARTPIQEMMVESSMVSGTRGGVVNMCFTVDSRHKDAIQEYLNSFKYPIEKRVGMEFSIALPCQAESTDTVVLDDNGALLRDADGRLVFHRGGHGALFEEFTSLHADLVYIKNIDNVPIDSLKRLTARGNRLLGGVLVYHQKQIHKYLKRLEKGEIGDDQLIEIINYVENVLNVKRENILRMSREEQCSYLFDRLNRPLRVCSMVKNEDEQGGVPCWVRNNDGTLSLQIAEYYQIYDHPKWRKMVAHASHFNPVDMVCAMNDYKGHKFNFANFADDTAFIVYPKEKDGRTVHQLEHPGLWNGCMAGWNTIFVELPVKTFNPVKNINDLLRQEHQIL